MVKFSESGDHYGCRKDVDITEPLNHPPIATASAAFDAILSKVGDYGVYQWKLLVITASSIFFTAMHNMAAIFLAATPNHTCQIPYLPENNFLNETHRLNGTVPWIEGKDGITRLSKCAYLDYNLTTLESVEVLSVISNLSTVSVSCDSWFYDHSVYETTIVEEWNLVCDSRWLKSSIQSSYMVGVMVGAIVFSALSDKMGRRLASLICVLLLFVSSVLTAFVTSFTLLLTVRFVVAASAQGAMLVTYILLMEVIGAKGRNVLGSLYQVFFSSGFLVLAIIAYFVRDWRHLEMAIGFPTALLLLYYWLLPESPRWYLMHGREKEGIEVLKVIAKANRNEFPSEEELKPLLAVIANEVKIKPKVSMKHQLKSFVNSVVILMRTPNMRRRNLISFYIWFVTSMVFYGLSFSSATITNSPHLSVGISALSEFPAMLVIPFMFRFGRRHITSVTFLFGGVACIAASIIPSDLVVLNVVLTSFGKISMAVSFVLVFLLSAELVPTQVRNLHIGMSSLWGRIGSALAPYIVDLLGDMYYAIPAIIFGVSAVLAGILALMLPETGNKRLPESVEEIEALPR